MFTFRSRGKVQNRKEWVAGYEHVKKLLKLCFRMCRFMWVKSTWRLLLCTKKKLAHLCDQSSVNGCFRGTAPGSALHCNRYCLISVGYGLRRRQHDGQPDCSTKRSGNKHLDNPNDILASCLAGIYRSFHNITIVVCWIPFTLVARSKPDSGRRYCRTPVCMLLQVYSWTIAIELTKFHQG